MKLFDVLSTVRAAGLVAYQRICFCRVLSAHALLVVALHRMIHAVVALHTVDVCLQLFVSDITKKRSDSFLYIAHAAHAAVLSSTVHLQQVSLVLRLG
jgi:hypothetical protein